MRIRVGRRDYHAARNAIVPQPDIPEDGLLPLNVFQAVYVSNSGGYVVAR